MPPSFEPLKFLETATAAVMRPRRVNLETTRRAILEEDSLSSSDDDDDDDIDSDPIMDPSPPKENETIPIATNEGVDGTGGQSPPDGSRSPPASHGSPELAADQDLQPSTDQNPSRTTKTPKKKTSPTLDTTQKLTTVTPCTKQGNTDLTTPSAPSATNPITPATTEANPTKRNVRMSLMDQAKESSLRLAQKLVEFTDDQVKQLQEESKRCQRTIKSLQQQLSEAEQYLTKTQTGLERFLQMKRDANKDYKKLAKQFEKCHSADSKKNDDLTQARKEIKQLNKRQLVREQEDTKAATAAAATTVSTSKKAKLEKDSKGKKKTTKTEWNSDEESDTEMEDESEDEGEEEHIDEEGGDDDWEGGRGKKRSHQEEQPTSGNRSSYGSESRRTNRRPVNPEWPCTVCTFLNAFSLTKCEVCGTKKK